MRTRVVACFALFIAFLFVAPLVISADTNVLTSSSAILSTSNYTENLSLYVTSSDSLWRVHLAGGPINMSSVSVPSSVTGYSITLTNYATWQSSYEIFTRYGFGILGSSEPYANGALLIINGTSALDAASLASNLSQALGLAFVQLSSGSSYVFFSPDNFATVLQTYLYPLIPKSEGGFATMFSESQLQSNGFNYFQITYGGLDYSLSFGGISALLSPNFKLYSQLGLTSSSYNFSSSSTSSSIDVYVLGGLISYSNMTHYNYPTNISSSIEMQKTSNSTVPDFSAIFDFSFPTVVAYRQVTPTLTPSSGSSVTVTITVKNISPAGGATAENVFVNDSWIYSESSSFRLTQTQTSNNQTLVPGSSYTVVYAFTVVATSGTFEIPVTPVTYDYSYSNSSTIRGDVMLNSEKLVVGATNTPSLEATATLTSGSQVQVGQTFYVNVTIANKGDGAAFGVRSGGVTKGTLAAGTSWSYLSNQSSSNLIQSRANFSFSVSWQDASGAAQSTKANTLSTILGLGDPGSPSLTLSKIVSDPISNDLNVTLSVVSNSPQTISGLTLADSIPSGMTFVRSYNTSSIESTGSTISANLSSIAPQGTESFVYELSINNMKNNYVFLPATVTAIWNNETLTHFSGGYGFPLGVQIVKQFSPSQGFQGANLTISVTVSNNGRLPIYNVNLNNSFASFFTIVNASTKSTPILLNGETLNNYYIANLTGSPGSYNSSVAGASFIFAGSMHNVQSPVVTINIFHLPDANLTYSALKVEEGHNIVITVTITNPSNFTLSNISYTLALPKNLKVLSGSETNFTIPALAPKTNATHTFTIITGQPYVYSLNDSKLLFTYSGHQLAGISGGLTLSIGDDVPLRYGIPVIIGLVVVVATLLYVRKLTSVRTKK